MSSEGRGADDRSGRRMLFKMLDKARLLCRTTQKRVEWWAQMHTAGGSRVSEVDPERLCGEGQGGMSEWWQRGARRPRPGRGI